MIKIAIWKLWAEGQEKNWSWSKKKQNKKTKKKRLSGTVRPRIERKVEKLI